MDAHQVAAARAQNMRRADDTRLAVWLRNRHSDGLPIKTPRSGRRTFTCPHCGYSQEISP